MNHSRGLSFFFFWSVRFKCIAYELPLSVLSTLNILLYQWFLVFDQWLGRLLLQNKAQLNKLLLRNNTAVVRLSTGRGKNRGNSYVRVQIKCMVKSCIFEKGLSVSLSTTNQTLSSYAYPVKKQAWMSLPKAIFSSTFMLCLVQSM